ncbi:MAG: hypothetical protein AAGF12_14490 [Myxococcota bacterium]
MRILLCCCCVVLAACPEDRERTGVRDASPDASFDGALDARPDVDLNCVPSDEICDGTDQDCDGEVDEGAPLGCGLNELCIAGSCSCPAERQCGGGCADIGFDEANCGMCGNQCPGTQVCVEESCCEPRATPVDLLFVIDNSGSMLEEQEALVREFPELFRALTTGDAEGDGLADFPPIVDLNVGFVTADLGAGPRPPMTCEEVGDDAELRTAGDVNPSCMASYPSVLSFRGGDSGAFATDAACLARQGTMGCGFEQQLEAALKALTPSTSGISFASGSGRGDGSNAGFLRPGSTLAVVVVTDEEDCSTGNLELFDQSAVQFGPELNLRCFNHPDELYPIRRYVSGLSSLRPSPGKVVFGLLAGVPEELVARGATYTEILADPMMQEVVDMTNPTRLASSCQTPRGLAFPPRRMVETARSFQAQGSPTAVGSICAESYRSFVRELTQRVAGATTECQ